MKINKLILITLALTLSTSTNASFIFTDVSATSSSVTFTIDGDMNGYSVPNNYEWQFSLAFSNSIYDGVVGSVHGSNTWSTSVFDNYSLGNSGSTGGWSIPVLEAYAWSTYLTPSLNDAASTQRTVTLSTNTPFLTSGQSGTIDFIWGNGGFENTTLYTASVTVSSVPIPATIWLFGSGIFGLLGFIRYRVSNI